MFVEVKKKKKGFKKKVVEVILIYIFLLSQSMNFDLQLNNLVHKSICNEIRD